MRTKVLILLTVLVGLAVAAEAHHSFAPYFDSQRPFSVSGTVVRVDWVDPAIFVHLKVEDKTTGKTTTWAFEGESFKLMERFGLKKDMLKEGTVVTIVGYMGKPGADLSSTVADPELAARVRAETPACIAQFEFANGQKFPVVNNVPEVPRP